MYPLDKPGTPLIVLVAAGTIYKGWQDWQSDLAASPDRVGAVITMVVGIGALVVVLLSTWIDLH